MAIRKGYKQTEFGIIPEDWIICQFQDVLTTFSSGATPYRGIADYYKGHIRWISSGELNYNIINETIEHISELAARNTNLKTHKPGTFLMAITGLEAEGTRGRCALIGADSTTNQSCMAINGTNKMDVNYLFWFYKNWGNYLAFKYCQGTKQQSYTAAIVKTLPICCPPTLAEQTAIATALSDMDAHITALEKMTAKKKLIKQGIMQQLLTGKKRLPGFSGKWVEKKLGKIGKTYGGITGKTKSDFGVGSSYYIPFLNVLTNPVINVSFLEKVNIKDTEQQNKAKIGDLFFNTSSETPEEVGICSVLLQEIENLYLNSFCFGYRIQDDEVSGLFLSYFFRSKKGRELMTSLAQGATRYNLSKSLFNSVSLLLPPTKSEQATIAQILSDMDNEIAALETKRDKYKQVKVGMMQELLTGKIRLVVENQRQLEEKPQKQANVHFRRSVWAAEIADRLCDEPTFGHVKMEKMIFLTEHICGIDIGSNYHRDVAGPYDNRAIRSIDSQIKKQNWFEVVRRDKGYRYIPMKKRGEHKAFFNRYYSDVLPVFDKIINTFRTWDTERCEIIATLYSAWKDLEDAKRQYTDNDIINEVLNNWNESKKRIPEERWYKALDWMRKNGFTPNKQE